MDKSSSRKQPFWQIKYFVNGWKIRAFCFSHRSKTTPYGARVPAKGYGLPRERADVRFAFIDVDKTNYPIKRLCKILGVSESGHHARLKRPESPRAKDNRLLSIRIESEFERRSWTYGSPRIKLELDAQDIRAGKHRVTRLMNETGIRASAPKRFKATTLSKHKFSGARNLVERRFDGYGSAPNRLWVGDITYVRTYQGWMYFCVFLDVYSRSDVGYSFEDTMEASIVNDALKMGLRSRRVGDGMTVHSDQGIQYASHEFRLFSIYLP